MSLANLNTALLIGTSGMNYSQAALATVSHNVVNANTTGYSRQVVQAGASSINGYGNGVQVQNIQRISDRFMVSRVLTATSDASYATTKSSYMTSLEDTFTRASTGGGLESVVGGFISSLNNLAADPSNSSLRRTAVQKADLTANALNNVNSDLQSVANDADNAISAQLDVVNQTLKDIYSLNLQIVGLQSSGNGGNTNDLNDARAQKIASLSENFGLQVTYNTSSGGVRITTENGRKLVDESGYVQLARGPLSGTYRSIVAQNVLLDGSLSSTQLPVDSAALATGRIKALAEVRDTVIPNLLAQVDQFTTTFKNAVNQLSSQGTSSPAQRTLSSGNTTALASSATDLLTTSGFTAINGSTINISVTTSLGNVVNTTIGGTAISLSPTMPATTLSLQDVANKINASSIGNATLGGSAGVIATVTNNAIGRPVLNITSADSNNKVVMANGTGDALGILGMNNVFTGTDSRTIAVRPELLSNPDILAVARMRADGGVSGTDGKNITALAGLSDTKLTFGAAGGLGTQVATGVSYLNTLASNLAVSTASAKDNETFNANLKTQATDLATSVSGVNINEELAQMLVYQSGFQASARIISVVNDLLKELVNLV